MNNNVNIKKLTMLALLTTIALTIFIIEAAIPPVVPIPGVKLGLANIVTLFVIKRFGAKDAAIVLIMRIILATIFAGQAVSFLYSLCGGLVCLLVMVVINRLLSGGYIFITSIFGAIGHNIGQLLAAFLVLRLTGVLVYAPFLMVSGVITGLFTGLVCFYADRYIPRFE